MKLYLFIIFIILNISSFSKNILILHSFDQNNVWSVFENRGLINSLQNSEHNIVVDYLNHKESGPNNYGEILEKFKTEYQFKRFDIIISFDNPAARFLLNHKNDIFRKTPVISGSLLDDGTNLLEDIKQKPDFLGLEKIIDLNKTINLALALNKNIKEIFIINNNQTNLGNTVENKFKREFKFNNDFEIVFINQLSDTIKYRLNNLHNNSVIIFGPSKLKDTELNAKDYFAKLASDIKAPIFVSLDYQLPGKNIVGGYVTSGLLQGKVIGDSVDNFFRGTPLKDLEINNNLTSYSVLDLQIVKKFKYNINSLPNDVQFINTGAYNYSKLKRSYKEEVILLVLSISLLIFIFILYKKINEYKGKVKDTDSLEKEILNYKNSEVSNKNLELKVDMLLTTTIDLFNYKTNHNFLISIYNMLFDFIPEVEYGFITFRDYQTNTKHIIFGNLENTKFLEVDESHELFNYIPNSVEEALDMFPDLKDITNASINNMDVLTLPIASRYHVLGEILLFVEEGQNIPMENVKILRHFSMLVELFFSFDEKNSNLKSAYKDFTYKLAELIESDNKSLNKNISKIAKISSFIARDCGLDQSLTQEIYDFAPLHDIGKIFLPSDLLRKKDKLSNEDWSIIKSHTNQVENLLSGYEHFEIAYNIALYHHEKYDGSGYPHGLKKNEIPFEAAIVSIADVYDALRTNKPYREAYTHDQAFNIITNGDGRTYPEHFHPDVLNSFINNIEIIKNIWESNE